MLTIMILEQANANKADFHSKFCSTTIKKNPDHSECITNLIISVTSTIWTLDIHDDNIVRLITR